MKIAILGDYDPKTSTLQALNDNAEWISIESGNDVIFEWVPTDDFDFWTAFDHNYTGLWVAPGSPYRDMDNVLNAISYTRINHIPTLGNCGGFQHMLIEFARNVCGIQNADHQETNPDGEDLIISKLACSLVGVAEEINIREGNSILFDVYNTNLMTGRYFCNYGFNDSFASTITEHGFKLTAFSADGSLRAFELTDHPFFVGTLFQPALTSGPEHIDPLLLKFVEICTTMQSL